MGRLADRIAADRAAAATQDDGEGMFSRAARYIEETPWLGKQFGWVSKWDELNDRGEKFLEPYIGKTGARLASLPSRINKFGAETLIGSPLDAASTAATVATFGGAAPLKGVALASKIPRAARAVEAGLTGLKVVGRGADALQAARAGGTAVRELNKGNYGSAALQAGVAALSGYGATGHNPLASRAVDEVANVVDTVPHTPAFLARDAKYKPVVRAKVVADPNPANAPLKTPKARTPGQVAADTEMIRKSQEPLRFTRPTNEPEVITDPARLLGGRVTDVAPSGTRAAAIHPRDASLMERAQRDLLAAGEEISARNLERYRDVPDFRSRIQGRATELGSPGAYEQVVSSEQILPAASRPTAQGVANVIPEAGLVDDVAESVAPGPIRFKTAKGSTYEHFEDGTTIRDKAARPEHPGDVGMKPQSSKTYYVAPEEIKLLDALATRKPKGTGISIRERGDGTIGLWYERGNVRGYMKHHKEGGFVTPSTEPRLGYHPVEVFEDGTHHFGNEITEVESGTRLRADQIEDLDLQDVAADTSRSTGQMPELDKALTEPYVYGADAKLDGKLKGQVRRTLNQFDKSVAKVTFTDGAERRTALVNAMAEKLNERQLAAAFEGNILNETLVREIVEKRRAIGAPPEVNVPRLPPVDETPNMGPANNMPPPGFAGRAVEGPTANGPMYWNPQSPEPISVNEGTFAGAEPTKPQQIFGSRQVFGEAAGETARPVERTIEEVLEALKARGVTAPTEAQVQKIMSNPRLLDNLIPPRSEFVPDVSRGFRPVQPPITDQARMIPEQATTTVNPWKSPEVVTDILQRARKARPRDVFGNNDWERAQDVAKALGHEDVANAIGAANKYVRSTQMGEAERAAKGTGMSMETELNRMGPAGEQIVTLKQQANTDAVIRFDDYVKGVADEIDALPQDRFEKIVDNLEGKLGGLTAKEVALADKMRDILRKSGKDMDDRGMLEHGVIQDYWPRRFDGVADKTIEDGLRAQGKSADEISKTIDFIRKQRELKTAGEYTRSGNNVPGYRKDKDVFFDHLKAVSNRVELVDRFGLKDTADPNSMLSELIGQTADPTRARDLMERVLRGGPQDGWDKTTHLARTYATGAMMQLSGVANLFGGALPIIVRGNLEEAGKSLFKIFNGASPEMQFMKSVNRFNEFKSGFTEGMTTNKFNKWYGIDWTQNQVNKLGGSTGLGTAKALFQELKANPTDKNVAWMLKDLVLENPQALLKQTALTDHQLKRAATRMVDLTQGVMHNEKLPYLWVRSGLGTVPQIFQRIAFQTTKAMKDGIAQAPISSIAKLGTFGLALGEGIAAIKEVPKTVGQVGMNTIQQELGYTKEDKDLFSTYKENMGYGKKGTDASRFYNTKRWLTALNKDAGDNDHIVHAVNALENSFAGGMPLTLLSAFAGSMSKDSRDPGGDAMSNLFVAIDEGGNIGKQIVDTATQTGKALTGGDADFRNTARFVTRRLPVVGGVQSGVTREIDTSKQAAASAKKKRKNSIYF